MTILQELNQKTVEIDGVSYQFQSGRLNYGDKKRLEKILLEGTSINAEGKPFVSDLVKTVESSEKVNEELCRIIFALPQNFDFNSLSIEKAEELLSLIEEADFLGSKKKQTISVSLVK